MNGKAFEPSSFVPRSIVRTFTRFLQQLEPEAEDVALQEFRVSRYQVLVSVKSLIILFVVPILVNTCSKAFVFEPLVQYVWNRKQHDIFLNSYQENRAFLEMEDFSERIFFESLIREQNESIISAHEPSGGTVWKIFTTIKTWITQGFTPEAAKGRENFRMQFQNPVSSKNVSNSTLSPVSNVVANSLQNSNEENTPLSERELVALDFQREVLQIMTIYNNESIQSICNILGESLTLLTIAWLLVSMKVQMVILKSFLTESFYSLSDTTKSFIIILVTDLLVGFHSPRGWEISLETILKHFGLPENQDFIFLFVATVPVFLDTLFKYWVFRYLNKISPSTVATYHNMIE
jgi:CemA family